MQIHNATRLLRETCALRHLTISTEKSYTHWLFRDGAFLKDPKLKFLLTEQKLENFLIWIVSGDSASISCRIPGASGQRAAPVSSHRNPARAYAGATGKVAAAQLASQSNRRLGASA